MATQEIDKLQIDIEVGKLDDASIQRINDLASSLEKITSVLEKGVLDKLQNLGLKLDSKGFESQLKQIEKNAAKVSENIKKSLSVKDVDVKLGTEGNSFPTPLQPEFIDETKEALEEVEDSFKKIDKQSIKTAQSTLASWDKSANEIGKSAEDSASVFENALKKIETETWNSSSIFDKLKIKLKEIATQFKKAKESAEDSAGSKNSGISKFTAALKRIALYRAVRYIVSSITNAFKEGITNVASYDKELSETLSNLSTSFTNLKNSLGLMAAPIIEIIAPAVQQISNAFVEIGNAISKATAQMKGLSSYTKISADYMEKYNKSASSSRFSFDTFETLNNDDSTSAMFETVELEDQNGELSNTLELVQSISDWISTIMEYAETLGKLVKSIVEPLIPSITKIFEILTQIFGFLTPVINDIIEILSPVFDSIGVLLESLLSAISDILEPIIAILELAWAIIKPIVDIVVAVLAPVIELVAVLINSIFDILEPILDDITNFANLWTEIVNIISELLGPALDMAMGQFDFIVGLVEFIGSCLKAIVQLLTGDFSGAIETIKGAFIGLWGSIKEYGINTWNSIKEFGSTAWEVVKNLWSKFTGIFEDIGKKAKDIFNSIKSVGAGIAQGLVNGLLAGINYIIKGINKMTSSLSNIWDWTGIPSIPQISTISWKLDIDSFANGGVVGEIWQMNEFGNPEMLFNSRNSGNTSVINQAQLGEAFTQAIINSGLLTAVENSGSITLDGKDIAQSRRFKAEMNRTNPKLNLR